MLSEAEQTENAEQTPIEAPQSKEPDPKTGAEQNSASAKEPPKPADNTAEPKKSGALADDAKFDDGGQGLLGF